MSRVLVVEPDRQIRKFITGILADFGHHVQPCRDAADARKWLGRGRFDVLASDLMLDDDVAARVAVMTLSGRLHSPVARHERPGRLNDRPFRLADLRFLVAAIGAREAAFAIAA